MDLQEIRKQLDVIDREILQLYEKRMDLSRDVAAYKMSVGKPVYDGERERQKLETVENMAQEDYRQGAGELFAQLMTIGRRLQYRLLAEHGQAPDTGFARIDRIPTEGARVVYQGVEGAYSHQASISGRTGTCSTSRPGRRPCGPWRKGGRTTASCPSRIPPPGR